MSVSHDSMGLRSAMSRSPDVRVYRRTSVATGRIMEEGRPALCALRVSASASGQEYGTGAGTDEQERAGRRPEQFAP
ncbi:hypothetical protein GCM10023080_009500 [Streptomyces pseudoechinosporeus]